MAEFAVHRCRAVLPTIEVWEEAGLVPRIVVITHRYDSFARNRYWLRAIAGHWAAAGLTVRVLGSACEQAEAELAVLHVDLTVVPNDYLALTRRFPTVVNGSVVDISKRRISSHLVTRGDGYDGPVIVKSDMNSRGIPEARIARKQREALLLAVRNLVPGRRRQRPHPYRQRPGEVCRTMLTWLFRGRSGRMPEYQILESASRVPENVWSNREFVVEQFLPERRKGYYCVRTWLFLGDRERNAIFYSNDPIIKANTIVDYERSSEVPEELRTLRRNLGFDYGKFDYAVVDGRVVLYDANRTPQMNEMPPERYKPIAEILSEGVGVYI